MHILILCYRDAKKKGIKGEFTKINKNKKQSTNVYLILEKRIGIIGKTIRLTLVQSWTVASSIYHAKVKTFPSLKRTLKIGGNFVLENFKEKISAIIRVKIFHRAKWHINSMLYQK